MKNQYLMLAAAMLLAGAAHGQGTELFFSEYNEGAHQPGVSYNGGVSLSTGNEKAIEIYNPTTAAVNLDAYSIRRYSNGLALGTAGVEEERLKRPNNVANVLNRQATYVIANPEATLVAITSAVSASGQYSASRQNSPQNASTSPNIIQVGGTVWFNGDDAMALVRYPSGTAGQPNVAAGIIVDIIGVIGERPISANPTSDGNWSGTNPADGTGTSAVFVSSANQSIVRRPSVSAGTRVSPAPQNVPGSNPPVRSPGGYNIADQWLMYGTAFGGAGGTQNSGGQLYDQLGTHNDYAGPYGVYQTTVTSTLEKFNANISVYPNPAQGKAIVEIKDAKVGSVVVLNGLGQRISAQAKGAGQESLTLDISQLKAGLYFVQIISADGQTKIYKELLVR